MPRTDSLNSVASIILAGGQGTRLYPLTKTRCKPSVCFGGRYRLIDIPLSNSLNARIRRIFVISQHFASTLNQHIVDTYPLEQFKEVQIDLLCSEHLSLKGTADAIRQYRAALESAVVDYFLVLAGDQLYNIDFVEMLSCAKERDDDLVIVSLPVEEQEARRMGLLELDENQKILSFVEKPSEPSVIARYQVLRSKEQSPRFLASMGIYIFKKQALLDLVSQEGDDFGTDLIPLCVQEGKASSVIYQGYWEDIGTIRAYYNAHMALLDQENCLNMYDVHNPIFTSPLCFPSSLVRESWIRRSFIGPGTVIGAKEITQSIVGVNVQIGEGTIIRNSILLGALERSGSVKRQGAVGKHCQIENAILDEGAIVGDHVCLTNLEKRLHYDGEGIYIREGITVVGSGTQLPDGFVL